MRIIVTKNYEELGRITMYHLLGVMFSKEPRVNLAITAGATPASVYEQLVPNVKGKDYLSHVHYYNFDEIPFKKSKRDGITLSALKKQYFEPANIPESHIHVLNEENVDTFDHELASVGGLDAILMGIGEDGHFCGNLPNTTRVDDVTTVVPCTTEMKESLALMYDNPADIPDSYVTMGPQSVMKSKQLMLIANGTHKAQVMRDFFINDVSKELPASILKMHPNLVVIMDEAAASLIPESYLKMAR